MVLTHGQQRPHGRHLLGVVNHFVFALGLCITAQQLAQLVQEFFFCGPVGPVQREQFFKLVKNQQRKPGAPFRILDQNQRSKILRQCQGGQRVVGLAQGRVQAFFKRLQSGQHIVVGKRRPNPVGMVQAHHGQGVEVFSDAGQQGRLNERGFSRARGRNHQDNAFGDEQVAEQLQVGFTAIQGLAFDKWYRPHIRVLGRMLVSFHPGLFAVLP